MLKREKQPYKGFWSMPGGKIEKGESPQETLRREIQEETALEIKNLKLKGLIFEILCHRNSKDYFLLWLFQSQSTNSNASKASEGEIKWFSKNEILARPYEFIPSDFEMLRLVWKKEQSIKFFSSEMEYKKGKYILKSFS